ncbi:E3 ubiquitin-protein ligase RNF13 [Biomphalaria glabrata]
MLHLSTFVTGDVIVIDLLSNLTIDSFNDATSNFGPSFSDDGLLARVVPADPPDGCTPLKPPPNMVLNDSYVWVALISRSINCKFTEKVKNAQLANYSAAIVYNNNSEELVHMSGDGKGIKIPSTFVGSSTGLQLKNKYNYTRQDIIIQIVEDNGPIIDFLVWPFVLVIGICFLIGLVYLIIKLCKDHLNKKVNRLSSKHLKKIPVRKFKKGEYYDTCAICLDEYEEGEKIRVLPCDHVYHTKCIDPWLTKNKKTCPVCKRRVIPGRDADSESSDSDGGGRAQSTGSESTPLLRGQQSTRPYASRGQRRFPPRNGQGTSRDGNENVLNPASEGNPVVPSLSEPEDDDGAVGGLTITDLYIQARDAAQKRRERKRKRTERERLIDREDAGDGSEPMAPGLVEFGESASGSVVVNETREERRERRRKRKEQKKASKRSNAQSEAPAAGESSSAGNVRRSEENGSHLGDDTNEVVVQVAERSEPKPPSDRQEPRALPLRGRHHELNEVV